MTLNSFGCSFIFGSDLQDDGRDGPYATASDLTWPALLAQHVGHSYMCYARPGAGNLRIAEQVLKQIPSAEPNDLFVIGWTWIDRFDYYPADPVDRSCDPWRTIMPVDETHVARIYYKELHSEYRDKLTTLINMKLVINSLREKNIQFIMTYMDALTFDRRWNTSSAVSDLQDFVEPYMTQFNGMSFLDWSRANHFAESVKWHPLEQAHAAAAQQLIAQGLL